MSTENKGLSPEIKKRFLEELEILGFELANQKPVGSGKFGCVYKAKAKSGDLAAFKVIEIPSGIIRKKREVLMESVAEGVYN